MSKSNATKLSLCLVAIGFAGVLVSQAVAGRTAPLRATYSQFLHDVQKGRVIAVTITPGSTAAVPATYRLRDGRTSSTLLPSDYRDAIAVLQNESVDIEIRESSWRPVVNSVPFFLLLAIWGVLITRKRNGGTRIV